MSTTRRRLDAVSVLTVFVALLFILPGHMVFEPFGAFGTPAMLIALACSFWWVAGWVTPKIGLAQGPQPIRVLILVHAWYMMLAYAVGWMRPLTVLERNSSNRALLTLVALSGIALIAADGIDSRERLETLLRRVVNGGCLAAAVGITQFFTGVRLVNYLKVPGLTANQYLDAVGSRSAFNRPFATMMHPIEFGVVVAALLPLALHFAFTADRKSRPRAWMKVGLLAAAIPMSVSRSAIVALTAAGLGLFAAWQWRRRVNVAVAGVGFTVMMWALVPGLIGTVRGLFVGLESDTSIQARIDRIPKITALFSERPWFGRGLGTFSADEYFLVDNEWYVSAIETGIVGLAVIVALIVGAILVTRRAGRSYGDCQSKHLGYAIGATMLALFATIGTFDAFFYRIFTGVLFLMIGCAGVLHRLQGETHPW